MNAQITFSISDIGIFVIWTLGVIILVLVIGILLNAFRAIGNISKIIKENRNNINKVLDEAPGITKNINTISGEVAHGTEVFRPTVDNIADTTGSVTGVISENTDIVDTLSTVFIVLNAVKNGFDKLFSKKTDTSKKGPRSESSQRQSSDTHAGNDSAHFNSNSKEKPAGSTSASVMDSWDNIRDTVDNVAKNMPKSSTSADK